MYILSIYPKEKTGYEGEEKERNMSRLVRVSDSVRHAQAQGLARRIQRAAKLRTRHRAKTKSSKAAFCLSFYFLFVYDI